jgi:hypothetical protein
MSRSEAAVRRRNSKWHKHQRNLQREASGEFRLYSDETPEGCSIIRWITYEAGEKMVKQRCARHVVDKAGRHTGYQLHQSFTAPQPVVMTAI